MPKGLGSRYWEEIMLALIGQQFTIHGNLKNETEEICGAVISIRYNEDILGIWNRNAAPSNHVEIEKIRVAVQKILQLPTQAHMEYKPHETSLQDRTGGTSGSKSLGTTKTGDTSVSTATATTSTSTNSNHHSSNNNHHHHHHSHSTSTSSRRSGSWTERDKTASSNSNAGVKHHHHKDGNAAPRGSWRN
jgi:translation initiation factor 4E